MNFNGSFRKDMNYNSIKNHKKHGFNFSLENTFLKKKKIGLDQIETYSSQPF